MRVGPMHSRAGIGGRGAGPICARARPLWLCAERPRRRGSHGRWGRHVQGRHDLEQQGGACAPIALARPASHGENAHAFFILHVAWCVPRRAHATQCGRHVVREPLHFAIRCMLHVARCGTPMGGARGAAHALYATWCTLYDVRCMPPESSMCEHSFMITAEGANPMRTRSAPPAAHARRLPRDAAAI
jgi:hypothetical protein